MIVLQNIHSSVILTLKGTELNSKNHESLKALSKVLRPMIFKDSQN